MQRSVAPRAKKKTIICTTKKNSICVDISDTRSASTILKYVK